MDDSEGNVDSDANFGQNGESTPKNAVKPKRRSLVERELETSLTARVTSPVSGGEAIGNTSRYGRKRRLKTDVEFCDFDKAVTAMFKRPNYEKSPVRSPAQKVNTSNTLTKQDSPKDSVTQAASPSTENKIVNIITNNIPRSHFGTEEREEELPAKKINKIYIRKDLIQSKEKDTACIMKNMFSPTKSLYKPSTNTHLSNILERSSEKYSLNVPENKQNGYLDTSSVVKTLDFDSGKKKKSEEIGSNMVSMSEQFEREAKCEYQVGDLAWSRVGTYPFWPCIVTKDPFSGFFVKKKLFGRVERDVLHVTFFGDNGRRGWIVDNMMRRFHGFDEFVATRDGFTSQLKKKDPRYYAAFFVSDKKQQSWNISVQEAESLMREPKRLRIDALNDLLGRTRVMKTTPKRQRSERIVRTDSDVSLSESLYDTLFSEDDSKADESDKTKNKPRKSSLDVSEVVTACLDNMAAKTGILKIQKQSHMDRWLQKAKSKTPEKVQNKVGPSISRKEVKGSNSVKKCKKTPSKNLRQVILKNSVCGNENDTLGLLRTTTVYQLNEHDYTKLDTENANPGSNRNTQENNMVIINSMAADASCDIGIISKVETLDRNVTEEKPTEMFDIENNMSVATVIEIKEGNDGNEMDASDGSSLKDLVTELAESKTDLEKDKCDNKKIPMDLDVQQDLISIKDQESAENDLPKDPINANGSQSQYITMPSNNEAMQNSKSPSYRVTRKSKRLSLDPDTKTSKSKALEQEGIVNGDLSQEHKKQHHDKDLKNCNKPEKCCEKSPKNVIQENKGEKCMVKRIKRDVKQVQMNAVKSDALTKNVHEKSSKKRKSVNKGGQLENNPTSHKESIGIKNVNVTKVVDVVVARDVAKILEDFSDVDEESLLKELSEISSKPSSVNEQIVKQNSKEQVNRDSDQREICPVEANKEVFKDFLKTTENSVSEVNGNLNRAKELTNNVAEDAKSTPNRDLKTETRVDDITTKSKKAELAEEARNTPQELSGLEELLLAQLQQSERESKQGDEILLSKNKQLIEKENVADSMSMLIDEDIMVAHEVKSEVNVADSMSMLIDEDIMVAHEVKSEVNRTVGTADKNQEKFEPMQVSPIEDFAIANKIFESDKIAQASLVDEENCFEPESPRYENMSLHKEPSKLKIKTESVSKQNHEKIITNNSKKNMDSTPKLPKATSYNYYNDELIPLRDLEVKIMRMPIVPFQKNLEELKEKNKNTATDAVDKQKNAEEVTEPEKKTKIAEQVVEDVKKISEKNTEPGLQDKEKRTENITVTAVEGKITVTDAKPIVKVTENVIADKKQATTTDKQQADEKLSEAIVENKKNPTEKVTEIVVENKEEVTENVKEAVVEVNGKLSEKNTEQVDEEKKQLSENVTEPAVDVCKDMIKSESGSIDSDLEDTISLAAMCRSYSEESKTSKESKSGYTTKDCAKPKRKPSKDKNTMHDKMGVHQALEDPEFLKYIELRQDALIDENPHVTEDEILEYLFKTWLYSENLKSDTVKSFDKEQSTLVKGLSDEPPPQPKKIRKKIKLEKDTEKQPQQTEDIVPKDRSKRKVARAYYNENDTDLEDELQVFEIFKMTNKQPAKSEFENAGSPHTEATLETVTEKTEQTESEVIDEVEMFFSQLAIPKPNVFKGMPRERLCEICEKPGSLIKCKGLCGGMYHSDCVRRQAEEPPEAPNGPTRGRKKKKRGRKPKSFDDSGSQSDDKKDLNVSEETISDEIQLENNLVIDADNFESQLEVKMKEMLKTELPADYDYSSEDELHWNDAVTGKCEIVDVKLKLKRPENDHGDFKCNDCLKSDIPVCFVCKSAKSPKNAVELRQKCQTAHCYKYYHLECLDIWPQTQFNSGEPSRNNKKISESFEAMTCPRHVCHTCVCDDPRGCNTRFSADKLAKCVRCPATYHSLNKCIPAGSTILSASHIICPRHYEHRPGKVPCHVNTGWCFICALGGTLICCEYCPTSFHAECLNIKPPEGNYMCEDCETGRLPLYGEMMWVKLGHYRWWPGIVLHPCEIPENIMAVKHSQGEFVVRFFGQYDHYWVNRGRVFPFQEGDSGKVSAQKSKIDEAFTMAMEHAQRACEILKNAAPNEEEDIDIASSLLPPHYVKLKVNKPCGALVNYKPDDEENSLTLCECDPNDIEPCGPDTHCLNRMLLTECGPTCRAGDRCCNRAFENRLYPKMTPYRTSWGGWGLKTLEPIKQGQFVIEYVGELLDEAEFRRRMQRKHDIRDENYYFLTLDRDRMIDAGPKGNLARFMNHCCEPNCETQKWTVLGDVRVGLFAIRDIPANSEVMFNYNLESAGIEKKPCLCGAKRCSGYIGAKPKQDETQTKPKTKRVYKKRKPNIEVSPSTSTTKIVKPRTTMRSRPKEVKELTEIEKDLLIIKNATNGLSSDSESSSRLSSIDNEKAVKEVKPLKRKRVCFSKDEAVVSIEADSPSVKKIKLDSETLVGVGD